MREWERALLRSYLRESGLPEHLPTPVNPMPIDLSGSGPDVGECLVKAVPVTAGHHGAHRCVPIPLLIWVPVKRAGNDGDLVDMSATVPKSCSASS